MILSASTSIRVSGFEILFSTKMPVSASHPTKAIFQQELPKMMAESS
jgi:hypothetical protein